jgi:predicted GNAT superfamily acetyltransferase
MEIRKLSSPKDYLDAEEVQKAVWHFADREIVSLNDLVATQKTGGHVFGAFEGGKMIAFCFGTPGYGEGEAYHYSRMLGVLPGYQDTGLGHTLKLKQRDYVLQQGLDRITWTFDPLQSRNAYLNIEKLGCVVSKYVVNLYPESNSPYNAGVESDRFSPDWWIATRRVKDRIAGRRTEYVLDAFPAALETRVSDGGWREPTDVQARRRDRRVSVEIPDDIDALKKADLSLAQRWRETTREAFLAYFKRGYVVHGFASIPEIGRRRSFYLLEKGFKVR